LNLGLSKKLAASFPGVIPVARPLVELTKIQDPNWFAGFVSGDGGFMVTIGKNQSTLTGIQVGLRFNVGQNSRDTLLFKSFINYLGCGAFLF
jgi:hypothetical protein